MGLFGGPLSVPFGDPEEMYLDYDVRDAGEGAYITLSHPPGYGNMWSAIVADGRVVEVIHIAEGETKTRFAPYDPAFETHAASAFPLGDWDSAGGIDASIGQADYVSDKGGGARIDFNAVMQIAEAWGDDGQLSNWSLTGLARFATSRPGQLKTQAKIDVRISDSGGTRTVELLLDGVVLASGTSVGDGTVTLEAQNNSGLSGEVDIAYTADVSSDCWVTGRFCESYTVTVGPQTKVVYDNGRGGRLSAAFAGLAAGIHDVDVSGTSDTGVAGTVYSTTITIPGRPEAPGELEYVSGDCTDTEVEAEASATPGATYALFDVEELDGPVKLSEVAATYSAGTGTITFALPAIAAAAGKRRIVIVAQLGQIQDGIRRRLTIEYDASGNVVLPRPNVPRFDYARPNMVSAGRTIATAWSYDANDAAGVATKIVAFLVAEGDSAPADGATPDAEVSLSGGDNGIYSGSISVTAPANGNFRILVRAQTAAGTQSANSNVLEEPVPVSNSTPAAPDGVEVAVIQ